MKLRGHGCRKGGRVERGGKEQDTANRKLGGDQYTSYRCVTLSEIQYIRFLKLSLKKLH